MIKYLKILYNFLMKLKQYHAVHVLIIPSITIFIYSYVIIWLIILSDEYKMDINLKPEPIISLFFILIIILLFSIYTAIFTEIIVLILQFLKKRKIYVKSNFLLNNKLYNFLYLFMIFSYIIIILNYQFPALQLIDYYIFIILTLPEKLFSLFI